MKLMNNLCSISDNLCSLKKLIFLIIGSLTLLVCCSCGSTKVATQLVHDIRIDTVYMTNQQYDSIYIYKEHTSDFKPCSLNMEERGGSDTVYTKDVSIEYRYKMLRDTIKVIQRDSIPYQVTIVETREITHPLTWFDRLSRAVFWLNVGFVLLIAIRLIRKINH